MSSNSECLVFACHRGENDDDAARAEDIVERSGRNPETGHEVVGDPGIVGADPATERLQQRRKGAREIAEADQPDSRPIKRETALGAVEQPLLSPRAHCAVRRRDPAAEVERKSERHFRDRLCESRARSEHMNAALKAGLVIDVLQEIGLDVDDAAQPRSPIQAGLRHVALADQKRHFRETGVEAFGRHAAWALMHGQFAEGPQPRPKIRVEDFVQSPWLRIDDDQRSGHWLSLRRAA